MSIPLESILIFIPIALALNITPGADMLFCLGQGIKAGPHAGAVASLGIATGAFIHSVIAGLGLATVVASHPIAFDVLRWLGVLYLMYLAFVSLTQPIGQAQSIDSHSYAANMAAANNSYTYKKNLFNAWRDGTLVCLFNPKVALFILALVPQFVDPAHGSIFIQFLTYGAILNIGGTLINALVGIFAGNIGQALTRNQTIATSLKIISSLLFVGLALRLALDKD